MSGQPPTERILRNAGVRPTPRRIAVFDALAGGDVASADDLHKRVKSDLVTVYRALEIFVEKGLVREVRFKDGIVRYEIAKKSHHHHIVCTRCGRVDELPHCDMHTIEKQALRESRHFARVEEHSLEFFGTCTSCAR